MDRVFALDRIPQTHSDVTVEDAIHAWQNCVRSMPRLGTEPEEHVGIGYDENGRLLELVAVRNDDGDWLVIHAQTPPQVSITRELGLGRRKR